MSFLKEHAVPRNHHTDGPPRLNSSRCGNNHTAAAGFNQFSSENKKTAINPQPRETMNKIAVMPSHEPSLPSGHFNQKQIEILKNSICKGVSNEEFEVFLMACVKTQLDPLMRQIYAVKRKARRSDGTWGDTMTIQTGIDGYRLIAERTERYAPGPEPTYVYDQNGELISATSYIKKQTVDGTWHTVSASAFLDEYCQKTKEGTPMGMWGNMPRTMLAKCAEAQALRKAFPAEMSGVYTKEEMQQADGDAIPKISLEQASELEIILGECEEKYRKWVYDYIQRQYNTSNICDLPAEVYQRMKDAAIRNREKCQEEQKIEEQAELIAAEVL